MGVYQLLKVLMPFLVGLVAATSVETSSGIVKREAAQEQCFYLCSPDLCRHICLAKDAAVPEEFNGALIINEADVNGPISIKMEGQNQGQCRQYVCVFRNCYYLPCDNGGKLINEADVETAVAGQNQGQCRQYVCVFRNCYYLPCDNGVVAEKLINATNVEPAPEGCRQVCNDDPSHSMCAMMCAPTKSTQVEKPVVETAPEDCRKICNNTPERPLCAMMCAPANQTNIEKQDVGLASVGVCWRRCDRVRCWIVCPPPSNADNDVEKRDAMTKQEACESQCPTDPRFMGMCVMMCRPEN